MPSDVLLHTVQEFIGVMRKTFRLLNGHIFVASIIMFGSLVAYFLNKYKQMMKRKVGRSSAKFYSTPSFEKEEMCREMAFTTTNYIHAVLSSCFAVYIFVNEYWQHQVNNSVNGMHENDFFMSYSDNISNLMSFTLGYLVVDLFCYLFVVTLQKDNISNAIFHALIVVAFSLYFVNGTGAIPGLFGEVSEIATIFVGQETLIEAFIENYESKTYYMVHNVAVTFFFIITRGCMSMFLAIQLVGNVSNLWNIISTTSVGIGAIISVQVILMTMLNLMNFVYTYQCCFNTYATYNNYKTSKLSKHKD